MGDVIWGKYAPKPPKMGMSRQFQVKTAKYKNHISEIINPIKTKLEDQPQANNCTLWVV